MNDTTAMETLLTQVPQLKLRKREETRTIHWSDVRENKSLQEGDVIPVISWVDDAGHQWTRADVMHYINLQECCDNPNILYSRLKTVKMETVH